MGIMVQYHAIQAKHAFTVVDSANRIDRQRPTTTRARRALRAFRFPAQSKPPERGWQRQRGAQRTEIFAKGALHEEGKPKEYRGIGSEESPRSRIPTKNVVLNGSTSANFSASGIENAETASKNRKMPYFRFFNRRCQRIGS
jgi:hypothetical protein